MINLPARGLVSPQGHLKTPLSFSLIMACLCSGITFSPFSVNMYHLSSLQIIAEILPSLLFHLFVKGMYLYGKCYKVLHRSSNLR